MLGLVNQPAQRRDEFITGELTNHLFQTPRFKFGMDLASINIQRGRDHGVPPYVAWRATCGLTPIKNWNDFRRATSQSSARKFRQVYATVDDVDLFTAGLAEKPVNGGLLGPTFACIIAQQFSNLRKGDRFWFENSNHENRFTTGQLHEIRRVTLAQILCHTLESIETVQPLVFLTPDNLRNQRIPCDDKTIGQLNLESWAEIAPTRKLENTVSPSQASQTEINMSHRKSVHTPRPIKSNVNQYNKVTVHRPLGSALTVVVKNHVINSPTIVNRDIYGSEIQNPKNSASMPTYKRPASITVKTSEMLRVNSEFKSSAFSDKISSKGSLEKRAHYIPQNVDDEDNPNPPDYGFNTKPLNNFAPSNEFFQHFARNFDHSTDTNTKSRYNYRHSR